MERFNIVVIGGGAAGLTVAAGAAGLGARVALVEAGAMGGECLNTGCVPSKTLLAAAKAAWLQGSAAHGTPAQPDWGAVKARIAAAIATLAPHDSAERFTGLGVEVLAGRGRLLSRSSVAVDLHGGGQRTLTARAIVLATGSRPALPAVPGLEQAGFVTHETVFSLHTLPRRLAVIGAGPSGVELSQAFARLGCRVTLVEALPRILPGEDPEAAALLAGALRREGVTLHTGARLAAVDSGSGGKRLLLDTPAGRAAVEADGILVTAGRLPNVEALGLDAAGVAHGKEGIAVNAYLRTSVRGVYACGDVAGPYRFTHMANQQARVVVQNALFPVQARMDYRVTPRVLFTDPEVAGVGLTGDEARQRGIPCRAVRVELAPLDRAVCDGATEGFLSVLTPPGRDDILGATLVAPHAGELIHEVALAMRARLTLRDLSRTVHAYPTLAEMFRRAGDQALRERYRPWMQALTRGYLAWRRRNTPMHG